MRRLNEILIWVTIVSVVCGSTETSHGETLKSTLTRLGYLNCACTCGTTTTEEIENLKERLQFKPLSNIMILNGAADDGSIETMNREARSLTECYERCLSVFGNKCGVYSYSSNDKMCRISDMDFYESWTNTFFKAGVTSYYQYKPDSWKMVYRRPKLVKTPGWENQVTGPWMDNAFSTKSVSDTSELYQDGLSARVLKSNLVHFWSQLQVGKVRLGIHKGRREVKHVIFSGSRTSDESWLTKRKLISSSWTTLNSQSLPLDIDWWWKQSRIHTCRGFHILQSHSGCGYDYVYLVAIQNQKDTVCSWERFPESSLPKILYSPSSTDADHASRMQEADSLTISIQM